MTNCKYYWLFPFGKKGLRVNDARSWVFRRMSFAALFDLRQIFTHNFAKPMVLFADMSEKPLPLHRQNKEVGGLPESKKISKDNI